MYRALLRGIALMALIATASADRLDVARLFAAPELSGPTLRSPRFSPDARYVAYLRGSAQDKDRLDLWAYDQRAKQHRLLIDAAVLAPQAGALSAEEEARRERQRISSFSGIVDYQFSPDSRHVLVPLAGDLYVYDLEAPKDSAVRRITDSADYETDPRFSPRGRYVSYVRGQNLYVYDLPSGTERAITTEGGGLVSCGMAEFIAQEEMDRDTGYWWSPDETRIAWARVDESRVPEVQRFEILAKDVRVVQQRYPAAGTTNADVRLFVSDIAGGDARRIEYAKDPDVYLARVDWFPDSREIAVQRQSRDQKTLALLGVDAASGRVREILTERSDTWVDLHDELTFLAKDKQFVWASSRSGNRHLYLYDWSGKLLRALTSGAWQITSDGRERAVRGLDANRGILYFIANRDTPIERHLYTVSLRDAHPQVRKVTADAGWHMATLAPDARSFLDRFSSPEQPPSVTLRAVSGETLEPLLANRLDAAHPYFRYRAEHSAPEYGTLRAADGQTLHYSLVKPPHMQPGRRYPVVVDVYGGPTAQRVRRAWAADGYLHQILAQRGFVVFALDNRGSGSRGVAFESMLYRHMSDIEVEDQVRGVEFLRTLPFVDAEHVGVFGWSYGGYMALMLAMRAPGHFASAVAGAPVTDWALYDTHYTERYMGTPQDNPAGYASANVLTYAPKLSRPLLLVHGMADDNVLFTNSTALMKRLQESNIPFELMTYPGGKHGLLRHADMGPHGYATIIGFLERTLRAGGAADGSRGP